MKKILLALLLATAATGAQASDWFGGNDGEWKMGPYGPYWDESDWPEWTPMYWMEEFMDSFDDNNDYWGGNRFGFGGNNYGSPYGGGYGQPPYGYGTAPMAPYGYAAPAVPAAPYGYPPVTPQVPK